MARTKQQDRERKRAEYHKHCEKRRIYMSAYYKANRDKLLQWKKGNREKRREEINAQKRSAYYRNRERILAADREYRRKKRSGDPEWKRNEYLRYYEKLRTEMLAAYGGKCQCCEDSTEEFLTLDHIHGHGTKDRKLWGKAFYAFVRRMGFPKDKYRLLCMNCNFSIGMRGYCPHQRKISIVA